MKNKDRMKQAFINFFNKDCNDLLIIVIPTKTAKQVVLFVNGYDASFLFSSVMGYRWNKKNDTFTISGHGFSIETEVIESIKSIPELKSVLIKSLERYV